MGLDLRPLSARQPVAVVCIAANLALHRRFMTLQPRRLVRRERAAMDALRDPVLLPLLALAAMAPRIIAIVTRIDPMHFTPDEVRSAGGVLPGLILGTRLVDLSNVVLMLSPLAIAVPAMGALLGRDRKSVV